MASRQFYLTFLFIPLFLLACQENPNKHYCGYGYCFDYPKQWELKRVKRHVLVLNPAEEKVQAAAFNIQVLGTEQLGGHYEDLSGALGDFKEQIKNNTTAAEFSHEGVFNLKNNTKVSSGKQFTASYCYEKKCYQQWQILLPSTDASLIFALGYTAEKDGYATYLPIVQSILDSFRIRR